MAQFQSEIELRVKVLDKELADLEKRIAKVANPFTASGGARNNKRIRAAKQAQRAELSLVQQAVEAEDRLRETKAQKRVQTNLRRVRFLRDQRIKAARDVAAAEKRFEQDAARRAQRRNQRLTGAVQGAAISAAFPLLTGTGGAEAIFGGIGGALGGLAGGPLGSFAGGIAGSAIGKLVTDAENLNKELATLNARLGSTGSAAAVAAGDISELAKQLNITKEEAADLAGELVAVADAGAIQEVAKAFGPVGGASTFEAIAQAGIDEKSALQAIDSLRGQIGIKAAEELTKVLEIEGATALQAALLDEVLKKSQDITTETAKQVTIWDRINFAVQEYLLGTAGASPQAIADDRAAGIELPDAGTLDKALTNFENYRKKRNALLEKYKPKRGGRSGANEEERIQQRLASLQAETAAVQRRAEIESKISQARIAEDQSLINRLTLERELSTIREREEKAVARVKDARLIQAIAEKASAEAAAARSRFADREAERIAKAEQSFTRQVQSLELQLQASQAITREEQQQAELELQLLRLREANKNLTEDQLKTLERLTKELFKANNLSPIESYIKQSQEQLADTEGMIVSLAQSVESAMGTAISSAVSSLVTGAQTIEETLANMFEAIGKAFIQMAAEIIAKQLVMIALQSILKALGGATGGSSTGPNVDAIESYSGIGANTPVTPFAEGGFVTRPTAAVVGEGGQGEYVIPADRMAGAMERYNSGVRGEAVVDGADSYGTGGGAVAGASPITLNVTATEIGGENFVKVNDLQAALATTRAQATADGAKQGEARALRRLQMSPGSRRKVGI